MTDTTLERMTRIMEVFEDPHEVLMLDQVQALTALPRSTCFRFLERLVELGWLMRAHPGYVWGQRSLAFAGRAGRYDELREAAQPVMAALRQRAQRPVWLGVLEGANVLLLDKMGADVAGSVRVRRGDHLPLGTSALGKSLLAWLPPEEADLLLERAGIKERESFHQELRGVRRRQGLAVESSSRARGRAAVAAPVLGPGGPVAAICVTVAAPDRPIERFAPLVQTAGRRISARLYPEEEAQERASAVWSDGLLERLMVLPDDALI